MTTPNENDKNFGYPPNANTGDGHSGPGDFPRNNIGNRYTEQFRSQTGEFSWGRVLDVFILNKVAVVGHRKGTSPCTWLGDTSPYLGTASLDAPVPGSLVLVWVPVSGPAIIIGQYGEAGDSRGIPFDVCEVNKSATVTRPVEALTEHRHSWILEPSFRNPVGYENSGRPVDTLPGDKGWIDQWGSLIALLQGMAIFKGSELAQIQAFRIDDLLRIVGRNLETWTGGSESHLIQNGESVNYEMIFADTVAGALGKKEAGEDISIAGDKEAGDQLRKLAERDSEPTLRKRVLVQAGANGNLVSLYVCKDKTGEATLVDGGLHPGIAKVHIGRDGEISIQSTKAVTLKKVKRIRVPERSKRYHEEEPVAPETKPQFAWVDTEAPGGGARNLQQPDRENYKENEYDDQRLRNQPDFHPLPLVDGSPAPAPEDGELAYRDEEVTFDLRDDGSFGVTLSNGSSLELGADGDIRVHAARDLYLESGRSTHVFSGGDLDIRSKKNTEITSSEESIRLFAKKMGLIYTEEGAILLETNSEAGEFTGGKPEARTNSGIVLRTLKENGPIVLESREDKIITSSKKNTSMEVLDPASKFFLEAPLALVNLLGGPQEFKLKGKSATLDLSKDVLVKGKNMRVDVDTQFWVDTQAIVLSASRFGKFHAPPPGVDVAHTHSGGEFVYGGDAHGIFTRLIRKRTSASPVTVPPVDGQSFEVNTTPHHPPKLKELLFDWREEYDVETWYETTWAAKLKEAPGGSESWDLTKDEVEGTCPFPGKDIGSVRFQYSRSNPEGQTPGAVAGTFSGTSDYPIPSS